MRRAPVIVISALTLLAAAVALYEGPLGAAVPTKKITITGSACAGGHIFCFKPAPLTVKPGTKVIWTNTTGVPHTVTRCTKTACGVTGGTGKDPKLASPNIAPHKTYSFTFHGAGTYRYFCKIHGYGTMHGTITVHA